MTTKDSVAQAPCLLLFQFLLHYFFESIELVWHTNDHVQNIECVENYFEVLVSQKLDKKVNESL